MTRSELNEALTLRFTQLSLADIKTATDTIIEAITSALAGGGRVEIRDFGSFSLNYRPARIGRNPKTGEQVKIPGKAVPHYKMGKALQERVDLSHAIGKSNSR